MRRLLKSAVCLSLLLTTPALAIEPPTPRTSGSLASQAFFKPELSLPSSHLPLQDALPRMSRDAAGAWDDFFARNGKGFEVYVDSYTGAVTNIQGAIPLIPGDGVGNKLTLSTVRQQLGRSVSKVDEAVVADLLVKFVQANHAVIGVDLLQLGEPRVTQVTEQLWQVSVPQQLKGIPVRHGRLAATISHGNLILLGTESWSNVDIAPLPLVSADGAVLAGSEHFGLYESPPEQWMPPTLEIAPVARKDAAFGEGQGHQLVWTYGFQLPNEQEHWKVTVDATTGEVLALEDDNHYLDQNIRGGVYPLTNTGTCTGTATCGAMFSNTPMPWANTGFALPNNFTDGAGVFDYTSGTTTTTLNGKYIRVSDGCGAINVSASGSIDLGGANGDHDCTVPPGTSPGNTAASRSSFYELNRIAEVARSWLPTNVWLNNQMTANVNIVSTCNAFWNGSTVNFYRSGGGCRNTGEIAAVFDHEWGHGLDDNDAAGVLSNSSEAYADIAAIYRLPSSCVGYGFYQTINQGCGMTPDGTGYNVNEAQVGAAKCTTRCSGVRDADWGAHASATPSTPQNFVCTSCSAGSGPCGKQVHCAASPVRQAAWDFIARDLRAAPFSYDANTAQIIGNKIFYQGSGNVGAWHACSCTAGTSDGCAATHGYKQWLAADDDNGNINDGTPHMTAIHAAFNRHNIACTAPAPVNSGCAAGPTAAPTLTVTAGTGQVTATWTAAAGASEYWVMKSEGFAACSYGKVRAATVTGTAYTDGEVMSGRQYCYSIVPASSNACYGRASTCTCATPL
ncbi:PepSY domain-containing protein [Pyxidicoccus caerfyrddinensis]|uniref:PepSY domain-containing protein n=1 Tax=Pyxidicoccus caerfyrddinensis TaxID=2709663 RepID=UPI0013DA5841|nr:PepSY domain-containing protein [Pyxidicoccus caerfyrddinensis]